LTIVLYEKRVSLQSENLKKMTTVIIEDKTREGRQLLELIKGHKSVIAVENVGSKKSFQEASAECNATSVDAFFDELDQRIKKRFNA